MSEEDHVAEVDAERDAPDDAAAAERDAVPEDAREEVVTAVRRALARHGYAELTTSKVAAESEKSEAFFFYHYDTKEDLIVAFLDDAVQRLARRLTRLGGADLVTQLYAACDVLLGDPSDDLDAGTNVAMMELLSHAPHNDRFHDRLETYERAVLADLADVLQRGTETGVFRDVDPEATAAFLLTVGDGTAGMAMALEMHDVGQQVRERVAHYLETCVLAEDVEPPEKWVRTPVAPTAGDSCR
jgi:AcrR family transcriptional regulator